MQRPDALAAGPPAVRLSGVTKRFADGTLALAGIDLEIDEGEVACLLGPSGCGKSTLLRIVAGLEEASTGQVFTTSPPGDAAAPREATKASDSQPVGFVFQEPSLMPWASIADNVGLPLRLRGVPRAAREEKVVAALEGVGLQGFADHLPRQLSGGMKMRASLARALIMQPRLLLLDEPFAALDEITRARLNDDLLRLHAEQGLTVVFVTHSVLESVYLADRILVMSPRPGRIAHILRPAAPAVGGGERADGWRSSAAYARTCGEVSACLAALMGTDRP